jgi:hypothetical protein
MRKSTVALLIALSTLAVGMKKRRVAPTPEPSPTVVVVASPTPKASGVPQIDWDAEEFYCTKKECEKIRRSGRLAIEILNSACGQAWWSTRKLIQSQGRSSNEVLEHLRGLTGTVPVRMYYRCMRGLGCTSAVAYRQPPQTRINLNRAYFSLNRSDCEWASTMLHEAMGHSLGNYGHDYNWNAQRRYSVPYSLNEMADACCAQVAGGAL